MDSKQRLNTVYLSSDVYAICLQHALTSERIEIMGLLIGETDEANRNSYINACVILPRSDKQPDRVEIPPEKLFEATYHAEHLSKKLDKPMRVVGWYHSHPHITVWPSHIDLETQAKYETMDPLFVGLIFSVFFKERTENKIQVVAFQSIKIGTQLERLPVKLEITPSAFQLHNLQEIAKLPKILTQEEVESRERNNNADVQDELTNLHNDALETVARTHIVTHCLFPLYETLQERSKTLKERIKFLKHVRNRLAEEITQMNDDDSDEIN